MLVAAALIDLFQHDGFRTRGEAQVLKFSIPKDYINNKKKKTQADDIDYNMEIIKECYKEVQYRKVENGVFISVCSFQGWHRPHKA